MTTLLRFAWRELLRAKARIALIALILTVQAAALGGGYLAQASLYHTRDTWSDRLHLADLEVQFTGASAEELKELLPGGLDRVAQIPGVRAVSRRYVAYGYIEKADGAPLPVVVQYLDPRGHPPVDDIEVTSGDWLEPGKPEQAVIDRSFAAANAIAIGDEIVVNPTRFPSRFRAGGIGLSAEYLVPTANPQLLVPHKGSLGIVYASRESLDRTFPDELYNDIVVTFTHDADERATTDAVLAALGKLDVERVVRKRSTFGHRFLEVILTGSRAVTPLIAGIVALMAAIVALISVHRLVAERRREIGSLLAQGFSPTQLAGCIFGLGLVPGVVGATLGVPGAALFAKKLTTTTAAISGFPDPIMLYECRWLALAGASALLVGLASALPPTLGVLRLTPTQALRGGDEVSFTGLPGPLERLLSGSVAVRYAVRNVFRRVRLSLATAALVALAVSLPAGLLTSMSSWDAWARAEAARLHWDAVATFKVPLTEAHAAELLTERGIAKWDAYVQGYAPVRRHDGITEEMRVRGFPPESDLVWYGLTSGRAFGSDDAEEAILNSGFAQGRTPRLGEVITLTRNGRSHRLTVVGLITNASLSSVYVPRGTAQRIFGLEGKVSGAYLRYGAVPVSQRPPPVPAKPASPGNAEAIEKIDIEDGLAAPMPTTPPCVFRDVKSALLADELVTSVEVRSEYADKTMAYLASFNVIIVPFVGLSGVLAFFFLVSVLGFLLLERETEYATLRSLGYGTAEIARIVLTEVLVLALLGLVLSLGTWAITAYALRDPMAAAWFEVPLAFRARDFAIASVPTIGFLVTAALPGIRALMRIDLSSVLRGRAIG